MSWTATTKQIQATTLVIAFAFLWVFCRPAKLCAQDPKFASEIGHIDYFGYDGLNLQAVKDHLPIHVGDSITSETIDRDRAAIQKAVQEITGRTATDVDFVCCNVDNHFLIYVGLAGASSRRLSMAVAPQGSDHLDPAALLLNKEWDGAFYKAMQSGSSREDDSQGYSLSFDPDFRAVQLKIRAYAIDHEVELERILRNSGDVKQRQISAEFLGYAERSPGQIQALANAMSDSDSTVRNNAVRALWVLSSARNGESLKIVPQPFMAFLFSETWSDRNKGSLLLMNLTKQRDPALLDKLRTDAMKPLIEGARWNASGHAMPFLIILGRIGGLPDAQVEMLSNSGDKEKIILAAEGH